MATTYTSISKNTVGTSATSYTVSGIPSTYDDLAIYLSFRQTASGTYSIYVSGNTARSGYGGISRTTTSANAQSEELSGSGMFSGYLASSAWPTGAYSNSFMYIPSYTSTSLPIITSSQSSWVQANAAANAWYMQIMSGYQASDSSAISSLVFSVAGGNIEAGSKIDIYGVKNT